MKFKVSKTWPPLGKSSFHKIFYCSMILNQFFLLGALLASGFVKNPDITLEWGDETSLEVTPTLILNTPNMIIRYFAQFAPDLQYKSAFEKTQIDNWLCLFITPIKDPVTFKAVLACLDDALGSESFLVGTKLTIADLHVFGSVYCKFCWSIFFLLIIF